MRVFGILVVRNAVDAVRLCVLHHLCVGCERILVVDNGSSDGTTTVLRRLQTGTPLSFTGAIAPAPELSVLHAPLRARSSLDRKAEYGRRVEQIGLDADLG